MKITAFILLLLFFLLATESKTSNRDKQGREDKGNHGKDRGQVHHKDSESRTSALSPPASGQLIRLAGDDGFPRKYFEGRVEVYVGEKWGIVCDDNWDIEDAHVACRQLGFVSGAQEAVHSASFGTGSWGNNSILMDDVSCQGDEATISECSRQLHHDCTQQEAAGVRCVENSGCLDNWIAGTSGCYKLSSETVNTRDLAVDRCAENGGHLLTIETERENNFISNVLYALGDKEFSGSVLTGGVRSDNVWVWQKVTRSLSPPADEDISFMNLEDFDLDTFDFGDVFRSTRIKRASKEKVRPMQGAFRRKRYSEMTERTSSTSIPYFKWFPGWMPRHVQAEPSNKKYDECIFLEKDYEFINGSKVDVGYYFWKDEYCNTTRTFMPNGFHYMCEIEKEQLRVPECYVGNGADYRGYVSRTQRGSVCLKWNDPASTNVNPETHPGKGLGDHSYCRNPDDKQRPWCWVSHREKKFGFCFVAECGKEQRQIVPTTTITTTECYVGNGADYRGYVSRTQRGSVCLKWNDPASTNVNPETHPGKGLGDHSYCRNPDDKQRPWCWVSHRQKKFGFCYVAECGKEQTQRAPTTTITTTECYVGNGADYRGYVSRTQRGSVCLKWNDPASTNVNPETHPGKGLGDHSYCRNPDDKQRPWCWVSHREKKFGFCYVAECGKEQTQRAPTTTITTTECYVGNGADYRGYVSRTQRGSVCLKWNDPASTNVNPETHPGKGLGDHSYCRNPDDKQRPWCWVSHREKKFGFCYVAECGKEQTQRAPTTTITTTECYVGNGADYRGYVSRTQRGSVCLKWNDPASTKVNPETHPGKGLGDHSYCRNPDDKQRPWCWVSHRQKKFGFCYVAECGKEQTQRAPTTTITTTASDNMCGPNKFFCPSDHMCISSLWKCDNDSDCSQGEDEVNCEYKLPLFTKFPFRGWMTPIEAHEGVPVETCARFCVQTTKFVCRSFSYSALDKYCYLSDRSSQNFILPPTSFRMDYYDLKGLPSKEDCEATGMLTCNNSRCVGSDKACDGVDDCGDSSDESEGRCGDAAPIEVRLADGDEENSGRVEIKYLGEWGVVCDDKWDIQDANVVCRMLGYDRGAIEATTRSRFGNGNGVIMLDETECNGTEVSLADCHHPPWKKHNCHQWETAGVICQVAKASDNMCGPNKFFCPSDHMCISSLWKCDNDSDCSQGEDEVNCEYKLPLFTKFPFRGWMTPIEAHEGVPVETCARFCVQTTKFVCRSFSYSALDKYCYLSDRSSQNFILPPTSFRMDYYELKGLPSKEDCEATGMLTCNNSRCVGSDKACDGVDDCGDSSDESEGRCGDAAPIEVRLADGDEENSGRVEIKYLGEWGVVCDDKWDIQDANVVCRMLGYDRGAIEATTRSRFGNGNGVIMLDETECNGTEVSLADCHHPPWKKHNCHQWETAGVICQVAKACGNDSYQCPDGGCVPLTKVCTGECQCTNCEDEKDCNVTIQLVGGATPDEGRVEVIINGIRGTVCDDGWNANAANVTCKSLGYVYGVPLTIAHFGEGSGPIWFDDVSCTGREKTLGECQMTLKGQHNCLHTEDAGVKCSSEKSAETVTVRLRDGRTKYEGNVMVTKDGRSGYICDDKWEDKDARVICRMLGFQGGQAYVGSHFRVITALSGIILDDVQCTGDEPSLSQCLHKPWGQHDCTDKEYAGVSCLNPDVGQDINITIESIKCGKRPLMEHQRSKRDESEEKQIAPPPKFQKIIRGMNAVPGEIPWQVGVRFISQFLNPKFPSHWCGGTILSEFWILSAAHCFRKHGKNDIVVRTGDFNNKVHDDHEQEFKIDLLITHERYDDYTVDYDIALIKIHPLHGRGIVFNDYVQPACLPESNTEYEAGMKCHISGWGKMLNEYPNILQTALVPIISESVCNIAFKRKLTPRMFCAGYLSGRVDSCFGDSGGPLVCKIQGKYTVLGATSWGRGCAELYSPGVYAKVKEFLPWINQKMQLYSEKR